MPRISRELSTQKQNFVLGLLADNTALTVREIQEKLKGQFGATMNPVTIAKLKSGLTLKDSPIVTADRTEDTSPVAVTETVTVTEGPVKTVGELVKEDEAAAPVASPAPEADFPAQVMVSNTVKTVSAPPTTENTKEVEIRPGLVEVVKF